jgi:hypothetical protein
MKTAGSCGPLDELERLVGDFPPAGVDRQRVPAARHLDGSRIVGEVLIGLLDLDPASVRHAPPSWTPSATLADLLIGPD